MVEVSINKALEKTELTQVLKRSEGVKELKYIFGAGKANYKLESLNDTGYHAIFDAIFRVVRTELYAYLQESTTGKKTLASDRLELCAVTLRLVVEAGNTKLKPKTAGAVLDHITDALPTADDEYCIPLQEEYLKSLRIILEHPSHLEHLRQRQWQGLCDFLVTAINYGSESEEHTSAPTASIRTTSVDSRNGTFLSARTSQASGRRSPASRGQGSMGQLVMSMSLLTAATNAPVMTRARSVMECLTSYLSYAKNSHADALSCFNNLLLTSLTEDIALARQALFSLLRVSTRLWSIKSYHVKDQIALTVILGEELLFEPTSPEDAEIGHILNNVFDAMSSEYQRRNDRDMLHMDDVSFRNSSDSHPLHLFGLTPILESNRAVSNWMLMSAMSILMQAKNEVIDEPRTTKQVNGTPRKRRRLMSKLDTVLECALTLSGGEGLCAIQLLTFSAHKSSVLPRKLAEAFLRLGGRVLDDDVAISSWSMLLFAQVARMPTLRLSDFQVQWHQVWQWSVRNLTTVGTSRAASYLLQELLAGLIFSPPETTRLIETSFLSSNLSGPSELSDAALSLWEAIVLKAVSENPGSLTKVFMRVLDWLNTRWILPAILDRSYNAQLALHVRAHQVLTLLLSSTPQQFSYTAYHPNLVSNPLYVVLWRKSQQLPLLRFLVRADAVPHNVAASTSLPLVRSDGAEAADTNLSRAILEFLQIKVKVFTQAWHTLSTERLSNVNADVVHIVAALCAATFAIVTRFGSTQGMLARELSTLTKDLWQTVCTSVGQMADDTMQASLVAMSTNLVSVLPRNHRLTPGTDQLLSKLADPLLSLLQTAIDTARSNQVEEPDAMDAGASFASRSSQSVFVNRYDYGLRLDVPFSTDHHSALVHSTYQLLFAQASSDGEDRTQSAVKTIDMLTSLNTPDLIAAKTPFLQTLSMASDISRASTDQILTKLAESCMQDESFERCEAALCLCLKAMAVLAPLWTSNDEDDLCSTASEMYTWFLQVVLGRGLASAETLTAIAAMLEAVMEANPSYVGDSSLRSPRTSLFQILQSGPNTVRYRVTDHIAHIFDRFVLTEHEAILDDVVDSLPSDAEDLEGIVVRLYVLGELASKWNTLLRRSVYHLFETAAEIPLSAPYAKKCLGDLCHSLQLTSPREIFLLFSPQILYTWLEKNTIDNIPYGIYGYKDLEQLLEDVQNELVGQIAMRADSEQAEMLSQKLGQSWEDMLRTNFAKAETYTIARDISMPPREGAVKSTESLLRKHVGTEKYIKLLQGVFPDIVGTLFMATSEEHGIERAFTKRNNLAPAKHVLSIVQQRSRSDMLLPAAQQPSFRARYLLDELDFLCQRIDISLEMIWTAPMLVYVCRRLFDSAVPSLGSLYACTVLRRVRIVIALAGPVALTGYPLEMLLHAIRPFLVDFHCSEDAVGLFWYLCERGRPHLENQPSFVAGLAVATFIQISHFLASPQDSTTQESHFKATMSKAAALNEWLGKHLKEYHNADPGHDRLEAWSSIIRAAYNVTSGRQPRNGSYDRELLLELLDDRSSQRHLLSEAAYRIAVELLCVNFETRTSARDDNLGNDTLAVRHAQALWDVVLHFETSSSFRSWAAAVLGRAYAASGIVSKSLVSEQDVDSIGSLEQRGSPASASDRIILRCLQAELLSNSHVTAGQAERALQMIVTRLHESGKIGQYESYLESSLVRDLNWSTFPCPPSIRNDQIAVIEIPLPEMKAASPEAWASDFVLALCSAVPQDPVLWSLRSIVPFQRQLGRQILPAVIHKVLILAMNDQLNIRQQISRRFNEILKHREADTEGLSTFVSNTLLYLRGQDLPNESTMADRTSWLDVDLAEAGVAATDRQAYKTALLFMELQAAQQHLQATRSSRRSLASKPDDHAATLESIYQNIDDPDLFYGIEETASVSSVMHKLNHDGVGLQKLSFQSALHDSQLKNPIAGEDSTDLGMLSALCTANLDGLALAVQMNKSASNNRNRVDGALSIGLNLQKWDLPVHSTELDVSSVVFETFRELDSFRNMETVMQSQRNGLLASIDVFKASKLSHGAINQTLGNLAILSEIGQAMALIGADELTEYDQLLQARSERLRFERFDKVRPILTGREALATAMKRNRALQSLIKINQQDSQLFEIKMIRASQQVASRQEAAQFSLNRALHLARLADMPSSAGLHIGSLAQHGLAKVLWDQGETTTSINMLRQLADRGDLQKGAIPIGRSELLADLGHEVAEARFEKPDEIIAHYLVPAIKALSGHSQGSEAGRVFHDFAAFCDLRLQNEEDRSEYTRIEKIRLKKENEVRELELMLSKSDSKGRTSVKSALNKAKQWFELDDEEYRRLKAARENLVQQSLENYLLSLRACDDYKNDVLRFCALWLEQSESETANVAVAKHLHRVPSRKFAPLIGQLAARIMNEDIDFQLLLQEVLYRICCDHPYHGMYQMFVSSKTRGAKTDEIAASRYAAARAITDRLLNQSPVRDEWIAIHNSSITFVSVASEHLDDKKHKPGAKLAFRDLQSGAKLVQAIDSCPKKIPPPTMKIPIKSDCDYSGIPRFSKFDSSISIAGGVSAPKIMSIIGTDGERYKMLLKGGNDDLRQDSIMEQVFAEVSNLLQDHRATRQRQLGIRTYKVLPLTLNAGIIEFVQNTIPLHEYSLPAHQRYFPKDYKSHKCRKEIQDAQTKSLGQRLQAYRNVCNNFHPVLRFFFMERFLNPDEWFAKRLAYSRTTAAISILGHVLGLGDRHGHNILLDEQTGEVVHIDLGVAFEAGRILPVPEMVPFRLTRDIVDGMGLSGVEGVFRRCCNFTLEALRQDQYSIMTILDVLRYDPLVAWSVSPLRLQRMQENMEREATEDGEDEGAALRRRRDLNEPSEADRALSVVAKKLGKSLSVEATVNELIQQAGDERNLAALYCGWAAYA